MKRTVHMPFGEGEKRYDTAVVEAWGPQIGDLVAEGRPLLRVVYQDGSHRVVVSPVTGILFRWTILEGDAIEPGEPVAVLAGVPDEAEPAAAPPPPDPDEIPYEPSAQEAALARHHALSVQTAPHQSTFAAVSLVEVERLIERTGPGFAAREGFALEPLPFVVAAVAAALRQFPAVNARWAGEALRRVDAVRIALPEMSGERLRAPVLRDADRLSVLGIARERQRLRSAASLAEGERRGATFTLTDLSALGVLTQSPILHQPQVGHLTVGEALDGRLHLCLVTDARAVDGRVAAGFLGAVRASLERADFLFV